MKFLLLLFPLMVSSCVDRPVKCPERPYLKNYERLLDEELYNYKTLLAKFNHPEYDQLFKTLDRMDSLCTNWISIAQGTWDTLSYKKMMLDSLTFDSSLGAYNFKTQRYNQLPVQLPSFSFLEIVRKNPSLCEKPYLFLYIKQYRNECYKVVKSHIQRDILIHHWYGPESEFMLAPLVINKDTFIHVFQGMRPAKLKLYKVDAKEKIQITKNPISFKYGFYLVDIRGLDKGKYEIIVELPGPKGEERNRLNFEIPLPGYRDPQTALEEYLR